MVRILLLLLCLLPIWPGSVSAGSEQDEARAALERGEIKPLDQVLAAARATTPGDVIAVKLKWKKKAWIYSLKILTPAG
ncbi:MAG: peptidase, partial [Bosea sp.]|nr:peptidase [Bosea sp. (in: a-proteobacteria)]